MTTPKQRQRECWHDYINNEHALGTGMRNGRPKGNELWMNEEGEYDMADHYESSYGLVKVAKQIRGVSPGTACPLCGKVPLRCGHTPDEHPDDGLPPEMELCRRAVAIEGGARDD